MQLDHFEVINLLTGRKARQRSNKQGTNFSNDDSEAAVSNVEMGKIELKQQKLNTVARVNDHSQESPNHPPPGLDWRTLNTHIASLESRVTAGEDELKQVKEISDRVSLSPKRVNPTQMLIERLSPPESSTRRSTI